MHNLDRKPRGRAKETPPEGDLVPGLEESCELEVNPPYLDKMISNAVESPQAASLDGPQRAFLHRDLKECLDSDPILGRLLMSIETRGVIPDQGDE